MSKLVLVDGHSILNRAFYGVPLFTNSEGLHTNAVFGFLNILFKLIDDEKPDYLAFLLECLHNQRQEPFATVLELKNVPVGARYEIITVM